MMLSGGHPMAFAPQRFAEAELSPKGLRRCFVAAVLAATVLERFGMSAGSFPASSALFMLYGLLGAFVLYGAAEVSGRRLVLYLVCVLVAFVSLIINQDFDLHHRASASSLVLTVAMYLPYTVVPRARLVPTIQWLQTRFLNVTYFCALVGIAQFAIQFVYRPEWLFDLTKIIPDAIKGPTFFNSAIPVGSFYKANGVFFREPSGFSYLMALSIVIESLLYKRRPRLAAYVAALLFSYSGTGILALSISLLFPLGYRSLWRVLGTVCIGVIIYFTLGDLLDLSFTVSRVAEFGTEGSSAHARYVAPFRLLFERIEKDAWTLWFGSGPGSISRQSQDFEFHDPTWAKLLFEYGVFGFVSFLSLVLFCLFQSPTHVRIKAVLFFSWLIMGGHLLSAENNLMLLLLAGFLLPQGWPSGSMPGAPRARELTSHGAALG